MNLGVQITVGVSAFISSECIFRMGLPGSCDDSTLSFLRNCHSIRYSSSHLPLLPCLVSRPLLRQVWPWPTERNARLAFSTCCPSESCCMGLGESVLSCMHTLALPFPTAPWSAFSFLGWNWSPALTSSLVFGAKAPCTDLAAPSSRMLRCPLCSS